LIRALDGWLAKGGAEGLFCACSPDGLALALKVEDGAFRAIVPALGEVLRRLGLDASGLGESPVENSRGERVGALRVV
ncbi:MAG: asparaginase, partial [Thermoleophilia bacterium]|nr:asparaginase [Thermoleophilia bacterium]